MGTTSGVVLVLNFTCIAVAVAGITAGIVGHSWWKNEDSYKKTESGLWRDCIHHKQMDETLCGENRGNIFKFSKYENVVPHDLHLSK